MDACPLRGTRRVGLNLLVIVGPALESREVLVRSPPASNSGKSARDMSILFADFAARWLPLLVRRAELLNHLLVRNVVGVLLKGILHHMHLSRQ